MATKRAFVLSMALLWMGVCHVAQACKPTLTTVLVFDEGSASLGRDQIALLAARLDHFRRTYPHLDEVEVEGVARNTAPDARELARRRAGEAAHAVRVLFDGAKLHVSSNVYPPELSIHAGNYAGIDVVPPMRDIPDCAPVPIPDFKR